ncbi:MAG: TonB-dependent receptor [Novosphingobium sp.]|jgi:iron complex outermembrane receptor protein|nr:TonB-dependent receptor [Novosphingobium sp.]
MRAAFTRSLMLATSALGAAMALPALAQEAGAESQNDIVVTARRTEERLQDVPISISVYNQDALSARNIVNSADLATYTPSLAVNQRYGPEKASFAIRGFVQDFQTAPSVGVYFADVVAPRGASTTTGGGGIGVGALFDLANVQVLKGPQGTLFGRNTTGGAVLLVPQKPTDKLEGYVEGSAGNYGMWRAQAVLNIPLADTFKVRLGVDRMKRQGYLINHSGIGPDRLNDTDYVAARLSIVADLTPDLENYLIASYANSDNNGSTMRMAGCKQPDPSLPGNGYVSLQGLSAPRACDQIARQNARGDGWWDVENTAPDAHERNRTWQVINTTTWRASDSLTIKNIMSYAESYEDMAYNLAGDNLSPLPAFIVIGATPNYHYGAESTWTEELQFQGTIGRLKWQAGGYYESSDPIGYGSQTVPLLLNCSDPGAYQCKAGIAFPNGSGGVIPVSNLGQQWYQWWWRSKGLYAQGTYAITDKISTTAGLRYTWDSQKNYNSATAMWFLADNTPTAFCNNVIRNPGPGGTGTTKLIAPGDFRQCDLTFEKKSKAPTWTIDLEYKPVSDVMIFAKWSRGYRAGGVNTPFVFYETWNPEKVDTYEIGAKTSFRGPVSGFFNITGFYNNFRNQQIQVTLAQKPGAPVAGGTGIVNAGKSRIWGVEIDAALTFFHSLKIEAGYTYLNTRLIKLVGIPPEDMTSWVPGESPWAVVHATSQEGGPLALSPKNRVQLTGTYTLPLDASVGDISFGATFVHTDRQLANSGTAPEFWYLPATNLLNLNANWRNVMGRPIDLAFFMTNVTNAKFPLNVANFYGTAGFESQNPNEPRMWGFRLKYRFGN